MTQRYPGLTREFVKRAKRDGSIACYHHVPSIWGAIGSWALVWLPVVWLVWYTASSFGL